MNTRIKSVILIAATLSVSALIPVSAASNDNVPLAITVRTLTASAQGGEQIERGTSRADVSWALRNKSREELSPDVWVYSGYHADADLPNQQNCGTLIITFAHDRVADLKLVNKPAVAVIASNVKASPQAKNIASIK